MIEIALFAPFKEEALLTIFRLVKLALDELYAEGTKKYGDKLDETIRQKMSILTKIKNFFFSQISIIYIYLNSSHREQFKYV